MFIKRNRKRYLSMFFLILVMFIYGQSDHVQDVLSMQIYDNRQLLHTDLETAYLNLPLLLEETRRIDAKKLELSVLEDYCWYYLYKKEVDELINYAGILKAKAKVINICHFQAVAGTYLAEAYSLNALYDKAIEELNQALVNIDKEDPENQVVVNAKANIYITYSNVHLDRKKPKDAVKTLLMAGKEYDKLKDPKRKQYSLYSNYSNLAMIYAEFDIDSAEYFAKKSLGLKSNPDHEDNIMIRNYYALGYVYKHKKDFEKALYYHNKAEQLSLKTGDLLNINDIYKGIVEIYTVKEDKDSVEKYRFKLKDLELNFSESKNKSLHKMLTEAGQQDKGKENIYLYVIVGSVIVLLLLVGVYVFYRNKTAKSEQLKGLIKMIKANDPAFMIAFDKIYPEFPKKLLAINSELTQSEIEFCALIKIKLSTKEIAQIQSILPKSVQNKKSKLRKKLNISSDADLYKWFAKI